MRTFGDFGRVAAAVVAVCAVAGIGTAATSGWHLEEGVNEPSYAYIEPAATNLNIDLVALVCEQAGDGRGVQLQLYPSGPGPLLPAGAPAHLVKDAARAEIEIDGRVFETDILFAADRVILADAGRDRAPVLSDGLLDALQTGRTLVLRFDLVAEAPGAAAAFDGEAEIDLRTGGGAKAIAAVRRCAEPAHDLQVSAAPPLQAIR